MTAQRANALSGAEWLKNSFSIWRGFGKDREASEHPAPFPVTLAKQVIDCFAANRGGVLLDPFAGSGSSLIAGLQSGMEAVGFDINPSYKEIFERRLSLFDIDSGKWRYEVEDARNIGGIINAGSIELCITSPPYWNILNQKRTADGKKSTPYSSSCQDIGNLEKYDEFLAELTSVAHQVGQVLRSKGYFALNIMDIRKGPIFYPLHQDSSDAILQTGWFTLEDIIVWDRQSDYNSMRPLGYPFKFIINKVHEYFLIFRKQEE